MDNRAKALAQIADALDTLESARNLVSEMLINRPTGKDGEKIDIASLEDLHKRVTQAITVLPHSGRSTVNSTKGPL